MKKIEYRVFVKTINNEKHNKMYSNDLDGGLHITSSGELYCSSDPIPFLNSDFVAMRKTSWKDKNGKDIYEGDILTIPIDDNDFRKLICRFGVIQRDIYCVDEVLRPAEIECFYFEAEDQETPLLPLIDYDDKKDVELMEMIGNIYENPEFLEELED